MAGFSNPRSLAFCSAVALLTAGLAACGDDTTEGETTASSTGDTTSAGPTTGGSPTAGPSGSGGDGGDATATSTSSGEAGGSGDGGSGGEGGEGGGTPCEGRGECDDGNACTDDACVDGFCENVAIEDGTPIEPDGEPCTDDECLGGEETHTPKPAGALPSDEDGGCDGLCQAAPYDGECGLSLYRKIYPGGDDVWTRDALSSIWMGDDAPPPDDVIEAEQTFAQDRLMVWTAGGLFYERQGGEWLTPVDVTERFENLPSADIVAMTVAYAPTFGVDDETLTITTNDAEPQVFAYALLADGEVAYSSGPNPIGNAQVGDPDAPPQHTTPYDWGFARQIDEPFQDADWLHFDEALGGSIYDLDGSSGGFDFLGSELEADSALFAGDDGPEPGTVVGAYYDAESGQVFLIAP